MQCSEVRIRNQNQRNPKEFDLFWPEFGEIAKTAQVFFILQVDYIMSSVFIRREPEQGRKFSLSFEQRR